MLVTNVKAPGPLVYHFLQINEIYIWILMFTTCVDPTLGNGVKV